MRFAAAVGIVFVLVGARAHADGMPRADRVALAKARRLVETARSETHRRCVELRWTTAATRLPEHYRVSLHAEYAALPDMEWTIDVERNARHATVRVFDDQGVRLGTIPTRALDTWARTAIQLGRVAEIGSCSEDASYGFASHVPERTLAIATPDGDVLLETPHLQPYLERLDEEDDETERFASSWAIRTFEALAREAVERAPPEPVDVRRLRDDLRAIPRGLPPVTDVEREDREAVEARLFAHHLEQHGDERDVDLLLRKGFEEHALSLSLRHVSDEDLPSLASAMLCSTDSKTIEAGLGAVDRLGARTRGPLLTGLRCAPATPHYSYVPSIVRRLTTLGGDDEATLAALRRTGTKKAELEVRVAVAVSLWRLDRDAKQLEVLAEIGAAKVDEQMSAAQRDALRQLSAAVTHDPQLQARYTPYFAEVLHEIPLSAHPTFGGIDMLVGIVADLGGETYDAEYRRVLAHDSSDAVRAAIRAIASYDAQAAAREAHLRVEKHNAGTVSGAIYSWNVLPYLELFIRTDATFALADLEAALRLLQESPERDAWKLGSHQAALTYLRARTDKQRAKAALAFVRAYGSYSAPFARHCTTRLGISESDLDAAQRQHDPDT